MRLFRYLLRKIKAKKKTSFKTLGFDSRIENARLLEGTKRVAIGDGVHVREGAWIGVFPNYLTHRSFDPQIVIGNNVYIGFYCTITAVHNITIKDGCVISDQFYASDHTHGYDPQKGSPRQQDLITKGPVSIGKNCFIGMRVTVLSGVELGDHCVVGAHSVVTRSFPACSMVAGVPARLIKKFNFATSQWEAADHFATL